MRATTALLLSACLMTFAFAMAPTALAADCEDRDPFPDETCLARCVWTYGVVGCLNEEYGCPPYC